MLRYERRHLRHLLKDQPLGSIARKAGLSRRTLHNLRRGIGVPRADSLGRLASVLGVSVESFFEGS